MWPKIMAIERVDFAKNRVYEPLRRQSQLFEYGFQPARTFEGRTAISIPISKGGTLNAQDVLSTRETIVRFGAPREIIIIPLPIVPVGKYISDLLSGLPRFIQSQIHLTMRDFLQEEETNGLYNPKFLSRLGKEIGCSWDEFCHLMHKLGRNAGASEQIGRVLEDSRYHPQKRIDGISNLTSAFAFWDALLLESFLAQETQNPIKVQTAFVKKHGSLPDSKVGEVNLDVIDSSVHPHLIRRLAKSISGTVKNEVVRFMEENKDRRREGLERGIKAGSVALNSALRSRDMELVKHKLGLAVDYPTTRPDPEDFQEVLNDFYGSDRPEILVGERIIKKLIKFYAEPARVTRVVADEVRARYVKDLCSQKAFSRIPVGGKDILMDVLGFAQHKGAVVVMQRFPENIRKKIKQEIRNRGINPREIEALLEEPKDKFASFGDSSVLTLWRS